MQGGGDGWMDFFDFQIGRENSIKHANWRIQEWKGIELLMRMKKGF